MGYSRERDRDAEKSILRLCIEFSVPFALNDVGEHGCMGEHWYALACGCERGRANRSFVASFEAAMNRKPFLIREPEQKRATRIYVGRQFWWYGEQVTATSFASDQASLVACTYKLPIGEHSCTGDIAKRIRITYEAIRQYHASLVLWSTIKTEFNTLTADQSAAFVGWTKQFGERYPTGRENLKELKAIASKIGEIKGTT